MSRTQFAARNSRSYELYTFRSLVYCVSSWRFDRREKRNWPWRNSTTILPWQTSGRTSSGETRVLLLQLLPLRLLRVRAITVSFYNREPMAPSHSLEVGNNCSLQQVGGFMHLWKTGKTCIRVDVISTNLPKNDPCIVEELREEQPRFLSLKSVGDASFSLSLSISPYIIVVEPRLRPCSSCLSLTQTAC